MDGKKKKGKGVNRGEIESAIAKAVELRALHAALIQRTSPPHLTFQSSSPASHFSAQDYPVFTPNYEDEALPRYNQYSTKSQILSETWDDLASRNGLESHIGPSDQKSVTSSSANQITVLQTSPKSEFYKSNRRNSLREFNSISKTEPEENSFKNGTRNSNIVVPLADSHSSIYSKPKHRGFISRLFPKFNKKQNNSNSPNRSETEKVSQIFKEFGGFTSIETLKRELNEANKRRDEALMEVSEMKSEFEDLKQKLMYLETYCEELKKGLRQTTQSKDPNREKSIDGISGSSTPVSEEVMVEGFLQIVSEARSSMKHFCKYLVGQIDENDNTLTENLKLILKPSLTSKYSKTVLYHLEAIINQSLYQDFENSIFQQNGSPKVLDPQLDREAQFLSFVSLRNLSWNEVLRKGTKYHSEDFSKFCDRKMSLIVTALNWTKPWCEELLQAFFVAAKCIWLLHLLAFSFDPPLKILRVDENGRFDSRYMEDMFFYKQQGVSSRVKMMVMPGFYVRDRVLKCKVLCKYKSLA